MSGARLGPLVDQSNRLLSTFDLRESGRFAGCNKFHFDLDAHTPTEQACEAPRDLSVLVGTTTRLNDYAEIVATGCVTAGKANVFTGKLSTLVEDRRQSERVHVDTAKFDHVIAATEHADGALQLKPE